MMAAASDLQTAGIDTSVLQTGLTFGNIGNQLIEDTHLAPGTSLKDYLWDKIKSGAWSGAEGAWNGLVDLSEVQEKGWLLAQNAEMQQQALFNDAYREQAERNNMQTKEVLDELPEYAESFRSHKAAEYAQQIDELYDAGGLFRICGDVASGIGQMAPTIAVNIATGGTGGMAYLYVSAAGNAAAEARAGGADEETALLYGMLSGSIEVLTEQIGGGIPGLNKGALDDWLMGMARSNTGRAALKHLVNALGEGAEEFISEIAGTYLAQMWNSDEPDFWQTLGDAFYAGLIGTLTSACMSVPGDLAELNNAHTVDTALNAMRNGDALSGEQLARAERAMQKLIGEPDSESPWSRIPAREWKDAKSRYFDNYFPQMADLTGHTGELSGIDTSNIIFLPTGDELKALAKTNADANAVSSPAANNATATQNSPQDLSNVIFFPTGSELEALANANANAASSPAANNTATAQNGQRDLSNVIFFPTGDELKALAKVNADSNAASSPAANNATTAQNGQRDLSNVFFFPTRDQLETWAKKDAEANAASSPAANNTATTQNGQWNLSNLIMPPMFDNQTVAQNSQPNAPKMASKSTPLPNVNDMAAKIDQRVDQNNFVSPDANKTPDVFHNDPQIIEIENEQNYRAIERGETTAFNDGRHPEINAQRITTYETPMYVSENATVKPKVLHNLNLYTEAAMKEYGIPMERKPSIVIVSENEMPTAWGRYDAVTNVVYYSQWVGSKRFKETPASVEYHEMIHMRQAEEFRQKGWVITKENYGQYIQELCKICKKRLDAAGINLYNKDIEKEISPYAYRAYLQGRFDEVEAEWRSRKALNILGQTNQSITTEGTNKQ